MEKVVPMNIITRRTVQFMPAPAKPGLGFEIDRAALDKAITQLER